MGFSSCGPLTVLLCVFGCWTVRGNSDEITYFEHSGESMESVCQITQLLQGAVEKCGASIEQATKELEANGKDGFKAAVTDLKRRAEVFKEPATVLVDKLWRYLDKSKSPDYFPNIQGPNVLKAAQDCEKKASKDTKSESMERLISDNKDSSMTLNDPAVRQQLPEAVRLFKDFEEASRKVDEERKKAEEEGKQAEEEKEKAEEASRKGKVEEGGALVATASTEGKTEDSTTAGKEKPSSATYSERPAVTSFLLLFAALLCVVL